jgi:hypothetical protein
VIAVALTLAGCETTIDTAAQLQLNSYRELAAQNSTIVRRADTSVTATAVQLVRSAHATAYVVRVHDGSAEAVTDLPISVGYRVGKRRVYANGSSTLSYFQAHLGLIRPGATVTWVYSGGRVPSGAVPFALVGGDAPANISSTPKTKSSVWDVAARVSTLTSQSGAADGSSTVTADVWVTNNTGIPQYSPPLYVDITAGQTVLAAGTAVTGTLSGGSRTLVHVTLVTNATLTDLRAGELHADVLPADYR